MPASLAKANQLNQNGGFHLKLRIYLLLFFMKQGTCVILGMEVALV